MATGLTETSQTAQTESEMAQPSRKRSRKVVSPILNFFEKSEDAFARCLVCGSRYQHSNNTSNLAKVMKII